MDDWRADDRASQMWTLIDLVYPVEEFQIASIRELCDEHGISCERFIEVWNELLDESHIIINQAEERIY